MCDTHAKPIERKPLTAKDILLRIALWLACAAFWWVVVEEWTK